ncbi:MarR family winged helix-turn-helix transcriptional regulator [Pseudomonas gingeri]|uniref:MarR family transcriptional regulator n=1 Tax=Pseudomonas gingeri TaxID=117681 RepID=A0A7Y7YEF8_9PSED|nr:MarR family transcriptional regulator [Pseudomonas gingeri]NVZ99438.1 MarR family transcriptional regulator [Pseudomonas gingeri]NWA13483.1 MarR family transcriptional regulator [Pseudomonas gingeri]NWA55744.1 MarR family transcriptional regulator [Pseudomonas gingeri]NWA95402.1 MarR family transcriptional regulator [Pseudomonas gingeri]NWB00489.1 MarR family transcriptional regulator [Pseudomonas gingeri]
MNDVDLYQVPSFLIKRVSQELIRQAEIRLRPLAIGMASMPVLGALQRGEARTQAELARLLQVEQPSMAQTLARLERDGLIQRRPDPEHKRIQIVELTELGLARIPQAKDILCDGNDKALLGFSADEVALFVDFLQRANANLRKED